jgi:hypothetical protein
VVGLGSAGADRIPIRSAPDEIFFYTVSEQWDGCMIGAVLNEKEDFG